MILRGVDEATVSIYDDNVEDWLEHGQPPRPAPLDGFVARTPSGIRADWPVVAEVERLPFRAGSLSGASAHRSYARVAAEQLPMALADLHRALARNAAVHMELASEAAVHLRDVVERAGFVIETRTGDSKEWIDVEATRARRLPDTVGASMRVLIVGLNPSIYSADAGVGFARPGNRFWPAAITAGLVSRPLDPFRALRIDRVGMTNIVARATRRADELLRDEYTAGVTQLERLVAWLRPDAVCFVGVTGYRIAVDKRAPLGWQPDAFAGVPTYVMPNTSGVNAHAKPADFVDHLRAVQQPPT